MSDFDRAALRSSLAALASQGVYVGTSSWKYSGWCDMLYDRARYVYRGRFAESRFEKLCLVEYAEVFKTVSLDAAYYKFPDHAYLAGLTDQVPDDFLFALKVTDEITLKRFTNLPRFGPRAGQANPNFLNADLFSSAFLGPCDPFRRNIGLLMFEFSHFYPSDYARGRDFLADLDLFLGRLPAGWPYGVEIRNPGFLRPEYFALLARHQVAHVYNNWQGMPTVGEQAAISDSQTVPGLLAARFLLKPGRKYEEAVRLFSPYLGVKEVNPEARAAGAKLIRRAVASAGRTRALLYVNNRLEGNSLQTIAAMLEQAGGSEPS